MRTALKVFAGWFTVGLVAGAALLWLLRPMAGLAFLIFVMAAVAMFVAPALHLLILRLSPGEPPPSQVGAVVMVVLCLGALLFILVAGGGFNFA